MKIGIDLDGVVIDSENTWRVYEEIFDIEDVGGNNFINKEEPYFQQRYNWDEEIQEKFWNKYVLKASVDSNIMPGFKFVYNLLKDEHEFIVITARGGKIPELIDDAKEKFEKNNIVFDKYYWNIHNKAEVCKQENIDIMIDDNWKNCMDISNNGIKTLYFKSTDLKLLEETEYLKQVTNWGEIYRYVKEMEKMKEIVIASGNKGKIKETEEILKNYKIISMEELGIDIDVEEDQKTFEGNAIKKAETIAKALNGKMCIADDSGIEIEYLDGFPGVFTKRWHKGTDRERNLAIIEKLKGVPKEKRKISFITAIALSDGKKTICEVGKIDGFVTEEVRGERGFGFDEIFELKNGKTLAEISQEEKNEISARKIALESIRQKLLEEENIFNKKFRSV